MELNYSSKKSVSSILQKSNDLYFNNELSKKNNYIFKGDNFDILSKLINGGYKHSIDLIYIDPPFATKNSFMINSDRTSTISYGKKGILAYNDNLTGDEYIEFIRERLILLKELLSDKGSIYLHIDSKVGHYVKIIMDEIFGKNNYLNDITRRKSNPKNFSRKAYGNEKDMILFYSKEHGHNIFNDVTIPYSKEDLNKKYKKIDKDGRRYNTVPIHAPGESLGETGTKWHGMYPPTGRHWRCSLKKLDEYNNNGLIEWSRTGNPRLKKFANKNKGKKIQDIWLDYKDKSYPSYPTQKNQNMLDMIVRQCSNKGSIVLDAFAGSGSTLKAAQKFDRKFIGIDQSNVSLRVMKREFKEDPSSNVIFLNIN